LSIPTPPVGTDQHFHTAILDVTAERQGQRRLLTLELASRKLGEARDERATLEAVCAAAVDSMADAAAAWPDGPQRGPARGAAPPGGGAAPPGDRVPVASAGPGGVGESGDHRVFGDGSLSRPLHLAVRRPGRAGHGGHRGAGGAAWGPRLADGGGAAAAAGV